MKTGFTVFLMVIGCLFISVWSSAASYTDEIAKAVGTSSKIVACPGIVHLHTTFSDGCESIADRQKKAKKHGYRFMLVSDHGNLIESLPKPFVVQACQGLNNDWGLKNYLKQCDDVTDKNFIAIPGAEMTATHMEEGKLEHSHTLVFGSIGWYKIDANNKELGVFDELKKYDCMTNKEAKNSQAKIIETINEYGLTAIAAHPSMISDRKYWVESRLRYDERAESCVGLGGREFFNVETPDQAKSDMEKYCSDVANKRYVCVTSGCDSHTALDKDDLLRWTRATWVGIDNFSDHGIAVAVEYGRTYAATNGARLANLNRWPNKELVETDQPYFKFKVEFSPLDNVNGPFDEAKDWHKFVVVIYRDGKPVSDSVMLHDTDGASYDYEWTDKSVTAGEHWYFISVDGYIVSSPYCFTVTK